MFHLSESLIFWIWVFVGISTIGIATLYLVFEEKIKYWILSFRRKSKPSKRKLPPPGVRSLIIVFALVAIWGAAIASTANVSPPANATPSVTRSSTNVIPTEPNQNTENNDEISYVALDTDDIDEFAVSPDGAIVAVDSRLWSVSDGKLLRTLLGGKGNPTSLAFSPDGKLLAMGTDYPSVILWNVSDGSIQNVLNAYWGNDPNNGVVDVVFSPNGKLLAGGSEASTFAHIWNVSDGQLIQELDHPATHAYRVVSHLAFSPDGKLLATETAENNDVWIWSTSSWQVIKKITIPESVATLGFSNDNEFLMAVMWDGPIQVIKTQDFSTEKILDGSTFSYGHIAFSPDGNLMATGKGKKIYLWSIDNFELLKTLSFTDRILSYSFTLDGKELIAGTSNGKILFIDMEQYR